MKNVTKIHPSSVKLKDGSTPISLRYFAYEYDADDELEIIETDCHEFEALESAGNVVEYERHTVFANGVNQICLTVRAVLSDGESIAS